MKAFHGAWPALITPTAADGGVNAEVLRDLTEYLVGKGIGGLYICGSTGEGLYQSVVERESVLETVVDQVKGRVPLVVHVGSVATRDAVRLAQHGREVGADGISSVLPPLSKNTQQALVHYDAIAAAAPELPFFPYLFGASIDAVSLMQELLQRIPNLGGAKYTGPNMYELWQLLTLGDENWTIFSGMDEQSLFGAMVGTRANIGSTLNLMPGVYRKIREHYESGDLASANELQIRANRITLVLQDFGFGGALREAMRILGFDCGEPRLPVTPLPAESRQAFHEALAAVDFGQLSAM